MRHASLTVLAIVLVAVGCDEVRMLEEGGGGAPEPIIQSGVLKSRLSVDGIAALYENVHREGLTVENEPETFTHEGRELRLGPITQTIAVDDLQTSIDEGQLQMILAGDRPAVAVPVRIDENASVRICRFQVAADKLTVRATAANEATEEWTFEIVDAPTISTTDLQVNSINACPPLEDEEGAPKEALRGRLADYFETGVQRGLGTYVSISFLEKLGFLRGTTALRRLSPFDNRRGTLRLASYPSKKEGAQVDGDGTTIELDVGVSTKRAACAPPDDLPSPSNSRPAGGVDAEALDGSQSDAGLALAEPLLARMIRAATLGGFLCQGLDNSMPSAARNIPRHSVRLEDIDLDRIPGSGPVESVVSPGALPDLDLRPRDDSLAMQWEGLTIDLYGEVAGARVRLLTVNANVALRLLPSSTSPSAVDLSLQTVDVQNATLQTPWADDSIDRTTLLPWTRRLLVLLFEDAFSLPLPVAPGSPLELVDTDVRAHDLLLLFRIQ